MTRTIVTEYVYPPIPIRSFDWAAWYSGEEEHGQYGSGRTEEEAIADLKANFFECETCDDMTYIVVDGVESACPDCQPKMAEEERRDREGGF